MIQHLEPLVSEVPPDTATLVWRPRPTLDMAHAPKAEFEVVIEYLDSKKTYRTWDAWCDAVSKATTEAEFWELTRAGRNLPWEQQRSWWKRLLVEHARPYGVEIRREWMKGDFRRN